MKRDAKGYVCLIAALLLALCLVAAPAAARGGELTRVAARAVVDDSTDPSLPDPIGAEEAMPTLAGLSEEISPEQAGEMAGDPHAALAGAIGHAAAFLELRPDQLSALIQLLEQRRASVLPRVQQILVREQVLQQLLQDDPNPAQVGTLILEIRQLYGEIVVQQAIFLNAFQSMLDAEQQDRLQAVRVAATLQPILPAFRAVGLL